jgi:hypothetical protein
LTAHIAYRSFNNIVLCMGMGEGRCFFCVSGGKPMKPSPTMQRVIEQLMQQHGVDLLALDTFLRLDLAGHDSLVIDHVGAAQIAVAHCFAQAGEWLTDCEVLFFTAAQDRLDRLRQARHPWPSIVSDQCLWSGQAGRVHGTLGAQTP